MWRLLGKTTCTRSRHSNPFLGHQVPPRSLEIVSTRTTGPITPTGYAGQKWLRLLIDVATGLTRGAALKRKSEIPAFILPQFLQLQSQTGKTINRYNSDGAKTFKLGRLTRTLEKQGTHLTKAALHTSQQNALVERRFRTIFNAVRSVLALRNIKKTPWRHAVDAIDKFNVIPTHRTNGSNPLPNLT